MRTLTSLMLALAIGGACTTDAGISDKADRSEPWDVEAMTGVDMAVERFDDIRIVTPAPTEFSYFTRVSFQQKQTGQQTSAGIAEVKGAGLFSVGRVIECSFENGQLEPGELCWSVNAEHQQSTGFNLDAANATPKLIQAISEAARTSVGFIATTTGLPEIIGDVMQARLNATQGVSAHDIESVAALALTSAYVNKHGAALSDEVMSEATKNAAYFVAALGLDVCGLEWEQTALEFCNGNDLDFTRCSRAYADALATACENTQDELNLRGRQPSPESSQTGYITAGRNADEHCSFALMNTSETMQRLNRLTRPGNTPYKLKLNDRLALTSSRCVQNLSTKRATFSLFDRSGHVAATGKVAKRFVNKKSLTNDNVSSDQAILVLTPIRETPTWPTRTTGISAGGFGSGQHGGYVRGYGTVMHAWQQGEHAELGGNWVVAERDRTAQGYTRFHHQVYRFEHKLVACKGDEGAPVFQTEFGNYVYGLISAITLGDGDCGYVDTVAPMTATRLSNGSWVEI